MTPEDEKLVTLARSARARVQAIQGAAVRDETGRSYTGATVDLPSMNITALDLAVAQALVSGARGLEAAVVVGGDLPDTDSVFDLGGAGVPVWHCDSRGHVLAEMAS